jgi:hypothetical protein
MFAWQLRRRINGSAAGAAVTYPRFPKNAPGPFYTTGECLSCETPEQQAPSCLAPLDELNCHTYFVRQPETAEEIRAACSAAHVCCVSAIRYGGSDPSIIRRLGNRIEHCDHILPGGPIRVPEDNSVRWERVLREYRPWWKFWTK